MQSGKSLTAIRFQMLLLLSNKRKKFRLRSTAAREVLVSLKSTQSRVSHQSWLTGWEKWAMKLILLQFHFIALLLRTKSFHLSLVTRKSQRLLVADLTLKSTSIWCKRSDQLSSLRICTRIGLKIAVKVKSHLKRRSTKRTRCLLELRTLSKTYNQIKTAKLSTNHRTWRLAKQAN